MPPWASYLVKVYAWRLILQEEGALNWTLAPLGYRPGDRRRRPAFAAAVRRRLGVGSFAVLGLPGVPPYGYGDWLCDPDAPTVLVYGLAGKVTLAAWDALAIAAGLPLALYAAGEEGLNYAIVIFAITSIVNLTSSVHDYKGLSGFGIEIVSNEKLEG